MSDENIVTEVPEAEPVIKTVTVEGIGEVPQRFATQDQLKSYAEGLTDDQFVVLASILRDRKWTKEELEDRVQILRPGVDILSKGTDEEDDSEDSSDSE